MYTHPITVTRPGRRILEKLTTLQKTLHGQLKKTDIKHTTETSRRKTVYRPGESPVDDDRREGVRKEGTRWWRGQREESS